MTWVWVKIKPPGDHRLWSMFPLARVPFGVPTFLTHGHMFMSCAEPPDGMKLLVLGSTGLSLLAAPERLEGSQAEEVVGSKGRSLRGPLKMESLAKIMGVMDPFLKGHGDSRQRFVEVRRTPKQLGGILLFY